MALFTESLLLDLLGIVTALVAVVYAYCKWAYQYWQRRGIPYLEPLIPLGTFQNPLKRTVSIGDDVTRMYRAIKSKGWKHGGAYSMTIPTWIVVNLDLVKHVMTKDFNHFVDRGTYTNEKDDPLTCHLSAVGGKKWRNLRIKLSPTFTSGKLKSMFQTVIDCGLVLEKYIKENISSKQAVDIKDLLGSFSTDVIGSCAFGLECNSFVEPDSPFRKYGKKIVKRNFLENLKFSFCVTYPDIARALKLRFFNKEISDFFMKVVEDTVNYRERNKYVRRDFLQLLIDIKNNKEAQDNGYEGMYTCTDPKYFEFSVNNNSLSYPKK
ncbi:hypothetical protein NQ314_009516 [Rhamnusium bicolor]|uniref:Cytochrome P450 n=1 Tax=Rhamnusium bicolor TaxID=1586634 RepID=A0AAV8XYR1_9CUCU|nr:hypothetical protein NQ314_009516 [Rhamnusium bicolor]